MADTPIRLLLVDDHPTSREPLAALLAREADLAVAGEAGSLAEARALLAHVAVDVAVVDLDLPDGSGVELIREQRAASPRAAALVLSASADRQDVGRAVEAGAVGALHKSVSIDEIVAAVRRAAAGEPLLSPAETVDLLRLIGRQRERDRAAQAAIGRLTPREREVLQALADGLSDKEISENLHVGVGTVRNHLVSVFGKLGVNSRLQALVFALRHGVVEIG